MGDAVVLHHASGSSLRVLLRGAQIVSWRDHTGEEQLFCSSLPPQPGAAVRGGIPICWPQFGSSTAAAGAPGVKHGFARSAQWRVAAVRDAEWGPAPAVELRMAADADTRKLWGPDFELAYLVELQPSALRLTLSVTNKGTGPLEFTGGLHPYFRVSDVSAAAVSGLKGGRYDDCAGKVVTRYTGALVESGEARFEGETDRIYGGASDAVELRCGAGRAVRLRKSAFRDWVLWTVGPGGMTDLGPGDWRRYVCVEAAQLSAAVRVEAGATWIGVHTLEAVGPHSAPAPRL